VRAGGRVALAVLLSALGAGGVRASDVGTLIDAGWKVQQRWSSLARDGGFQYEFELRTWNGDNELKESLERVVRVENHGGASHTEILLARKDGRDETQKVRAEESRESRKAGSARKDDFPSPFDPRFRDRYAFELEPPRDGQAVLSFHPVKAFDRSVAGEALYDSEGRLRRVSFALVRSPLFTRHLRFTISFDETGNPSRVDSSGEVSLVVWKRRFESDVMLRDVHLASN
jgi:hypothetical protein